VLKGKGKSGNLKGPIKISCDEEQNSLIIMSYPSDYKKVERILEKLDVPSKEVLVEVTIAEVTLTDQLQFGIEWYLKHKGKFIGEIKTLGGLGIGGSGLNYSVVSSSEKFSLLLNTFAKKNLINIISTPHIVVLDGKKATINVGTQVPIVSSETTAPDITGGSKPSILRNVQYRNTGVILSVKPTIISNNRIILEIHQELSEAQSNNISSIDSPIILNRSLTTTLVLNSDQTVLLGGLISQNRSKSRSEVPVLGDIPFVGNLFKTESQGKNKTELIILITPHVIENVDDLELLTNTLIKRFNSSSNSTNINF